MADTVKDLSLLTKNLRIFNPKNCYEAHGLDPGSGKNLFRIPERQIHDPQYRVLFPSIVVGVQHK
jgi:hypothetical protein